MKNKTKRIIGWTCMSPVIAIIGGGILIIVGAGFYELFLKVTETRDSIIGFFTVVTIIGLFILGVYLRYKGDNGV